jgi:hypothetical protein
MPDPADAHEILAEMCERERELRAKAEALPSGEQRAPLILLADAYARQTERRRGR